MGFSTINEHLIWINNLQSGAICLGLDRVKVVAERLCLLSKTCPVITVAGTNGKGSTVAGLETIYSCAGYKTGSFTSPFLFKHNEQVKLNGKNVDDHLFCQAFLAVKQALGEVLLTPFEFHTLAALWIFKQYPLDLIILEVGLGGRLDAVNIIDTDLAIVTSIDLDHIDWLGPDRESIGFEKAGIFRSGKPAIYGDLKPPHSLIEHAKSIHTPLYFQKKDFDYEKNQEDWAWHNQPIHYHHLPLTSLLLQNMSIVLMGITLLQKNLPVTDHALVEGLKQVTLPGRIQIVPGEITHIFDVSHNPAAIRLLKSQLKTLTPPKHSYAVFSMLADKDIDESINILKEDVDFWFVAPLAVKRAASEEKLKAAFEKAKIKCVCFFSTIEEAYLAALSKSVKDDRLLVLGSFHTVANAFAIFNARRC